MNDADDSRKTSPPCSSPLFEGEKALSAVEFTTLIEHLIAPTRDPEVLLC